MNGTPREKVITRVDPVALGVTSWWMPLGSYLEELLNSIRVSHFTLPKLTNVIPGM